MARKKQEVALQLEINTQEEWEELMQKEGLLIVDVYQDWCGPCKAVLSFLRRMKNEIGDDILQFAIAKSDTIDSLEKYRGKCEPCFLIYGSGSLVSVIRGANPPALEETIKCKLEEEHKVMKGEIERKEIKDPYLADIDVEEKVQKTDKDIEEIEQEITLALIKPDVVRAKKVDEIISKLNEKGIEILAQQERNLTEDEARSFYHHLENSECFDSLIKFISSGPSYILVLAKGDEGIIHEFKELVGPKIFEEAKEKAPDSFRAIYGTNSIENAIHGADNKESVHRELAFFFPDFVTPKIARKKQEVSHQQRTLALIRPAAFVEFKDSILEKIKASGFKIAMQKEVKLNKEDAELFYKDHKDRPYFDDLTTEMSNGTLLALALEKQNAIGGFRGMLGPKDVEQAKENDPSSLRAQFSKEDINVNLIHGSDSEEAAQNELKYFFPVEHTIAAIKPDGMENREEIINRIMEAHFNIVKTLDIVMTEELAKDFYADQKDEEYFEDLITHMQSGPTLVMVLSREDAIRGWRSIMGPKDPNIAAESYPDSIRSIYGKDIKENAVYGSADENEVSRVMMVIFGKLEFSEDGSLLPQYITSEEDNLKKEEVTDNEKDEQKGDNSVKDDQLIEASENEKTEIEGTISTEDVVNKEIKEPEVADQLELKDDLEIKEKQEENIVTAVEVDMEKTTNSVEISDEKDETSTSQIREEDISKHDEPQGSMTEHDETQGNTTEQDEQSLAITEKNNSNNEDNKVDTTILEDSSEIVQENTNENTQENDEMKTNQGDVTEAEKTVVSEEDEQETYEETQVDNSDNKNLQGVDDKVGSEKLEESTLVEEMLITKESEEILTTKEDETLFEEINLGDENEEDQLKTEADGDNVVTETENDKLKDETEGDIVITETENEELHVEIQEDKIGTEITQPEDIENTATEQDYEIESENEEVLDPTVEEVDHENLEKANENTYYDEEITASLEDDPNEQVNPISRNFLNDPTVNAAEGSITVQ